MGSTSNKFKFFEQCDRWRRNFANGESNWHEMMRNKVAISQDELKDAVTVEDILDEDETLDDFVCSDPDHGFYSSTINDEKVFFMQDCGFEFIFTEKGCAPNES
jgi:hypothetical protein